MTFVARKFFIASLIYLLFGLLAQSITIFDSWLGFNPLAYTAVATTTQLLLIGWLTQLGLALIYDRWFSDVDSDSDQSLTSPRVVGTEDRPQLNLSHQTVFVLFNLGLPLMVVGQPGLAMLGGDWLGAIAAFGGLLQLFAGGIFVYTVWKNLVNP